jgi:uncharacterized membrane protein
MAKQTRSQKQVRVQGHQGSGFQHENTEVFDDNLLPDAAEIEALSVIDPNIISWLKERAEKEQDFRHEIFKKRTEILECDIKGTQKLNLIGMIFAFLIIMSGMALSTYLIHLGHLLTGSIFSGLTILYAAALFYKRKSTEDKKTNK